MKYAVGKARLVTFNIVLSGELRCFRHNILGCSYCNVGIVVVSYNIRVLHFLEQVGNN